MPHAVIVDALRTPGGKRNGKLKNWHAVDLASEALRAATDWAFTALDLQRAQFLLQLPHWQTEIGLDDCLRCRILAVFVSLVTAPGL